MAPAKEAIRKRWHMAMQREKIRKRIIKAGGDVSAYPSISFPVQWGFRTENCQLMQSKKIKEKPPKKENRQSLEQVRADIETKQLNALARAFCYPAYYNSKADDSLRKIVAGLSDDMRYMLKRRYIRLTLGPAPVEYPPDAQIPS